MKPKLIYQVANNVPEWNDCHKQKYSRTDPELRRIITLGLDGKYYEVNHKGNIMWEVKP